MIALKIILLVTLMWPALVINGKPLSSTNSGESIEQSDSTLADNVKQNETTTGITNKSISFPTNAELAENVLLGFESNDGKRNKRDTYQISDQTTKISGDKYNFDRSSVIQVGNNTMIFNNTIPFHNYGMVINYSPKKHS